MKTYTDDYGINRILDLFSDNFKQKNFDINFNVLQFEALHSIIYDYLKSIYDASSIMTTIYKSKNKKNKYFSYIVMDYEGKKNNFIYKDNQISKIFGTYVYIFIEIDIKKYKKLNLKCYINKKINKKIETIINQNIDDFFKKLVVDIKNIIDSISNCKYANSGICTYLGMINRELIGYYKTKYLEIDAGGKSKCPGVIGKKIKIKYSFSDVLIKKTYDSNAITTINTSKICTNVINVLLQLVLRTSFKDNYEQKYIDNNNQEENINNLSTFDNSIKGKTKSLENNFEDLEIGFTRFGHLNNTLPLDIDDIIEQFFKLNNKQQEIYYNSCKSYESALNSDKLERLFHLYKSLENIVIYEEKYTKKLENSRIKNMQTLIERYITNINFEDNVHLWYDIRNKYAHNGIDNSGLFDFIFSPDLPMYRDKRTGSYYKSEEYFEALVHFVLIKWLEQQ